MISNHLIFTLVLICILNNLKIQVTICIKNKKEEEIVKMKLFCGFMCQGKVRYDQDHVIQYN